MKFTLDQYQAQVLRTMATPSSRDSLAIWALGIAGEAGEVADYVKKVIGHSHPLDRNKLANEIGDVLWYIAAMASFLGLDLSDVATRNIEKLKERYPEGFSSERSINRFDENDIPYDKK